jgi:hypothetical protein
MNNKALATAVAIGLVLQLLVVGGGHFADKGTQAWLFPVGGMGFSLIAGLIFAYSAAAGWAPSLLGGAIAGGVCALVGIGVSALLKDVPFALLIPGTLSSVATGVVGAAIGRLIPH